MLLFIKITILTHWISNFHSSAPPPPPILNGSIPSRRIQPAQPQHEMPSCVQNAMMTKDKKPFTYTPGGIDLSQIKSPRMAQRISRNANMEGVTNQPKPSPLAQVTEFKFEKKCTNQRIMFFFLSLAKQCKHTSTSGPTSAATFSSSSWNAHSCIPTRCTTAAARTKTWTNFETAFTVNGKKITTANTKVWTTPIGLAAWNQNSTESDGRLT